MENFLSNTELGRVGERERKLFLKTKLCISVERGGFGINIWFISPSISTHAIFLLYFWQDKFCSNRVSASCWDVLGPWPQPQSQPLAPTETNHRLRLPSRQHCADSQLNLRFNTVEISLAIQSYSLSLSHYCIPHPLYFFTLLFLFLSAVSHMHHITYFLDSPVQLCNVSTFILLSIF